jgi:hypothetical protein
MQKEAKFWIMLAAGITAAVFIFFLIVVFGLDVIIKADVSSTVTLTSLC